MIYNLHKATETNIGDMKSPVSLYFDFGQETAIYDLCRVKSGDYNLQDAEAVIVGGGGLFYFQSLEYLCENYSGKLIGWGIGCNEHGVKKLRYPSFAERFDLLGVRDWGSPFKWVPCSTCMDPIFDMEHEVVHETVIYEHKNSPIKLDFPRKDNTSDFATAINHIASSEIVLTNTYHGMYWATLLARKVVVFPFSSRFYGMKYPVYLCEESDFVSGMPRDLKSFPEALPECRQANLQFYQEVKNVLQ